MSDRRLLELMALARIIKAHREELGWTQDNLADEASISLRTVQRVENAETRGDATTRKALTRALRIEDLDAAVGVEAETLLTQADDMVGPVAEYAGPALYRSHVPEDCQRISVIGKIFEVATDDTTVLDARDPVPVHEKGTDDQIKVTMVQNHTLLSDRGVEYTLTLQDQFIPLRNDARLTLLCCGSNGEEYPMSVLNHNQHQTGWRDIQQTKISVAFYMGKAERNWMAAVAAVAGIVCMLFLMFDFKFLAPWCLGAGAMYIGFGLLRAEVRRAAVRRRLTEIARRVEFSPMSLS